MLSSGRVHEEVSQSRHTNGLRSCQPLRLAVEEEPTEEMRRSGWSGRKKTGGHRDRESKRRVCQKEHRLCRMLMKGQIK